MRKLFAIVLASFVVIGLDAKVIKKDQMNAENLKKFAGSVYAYEAPTEPLTPAPKAERPSITSSLARTVPRAGHQFTGTSAT